MKLFITSFLGLFFSLAAVAQYTTPDTGVNWSLDDIVANSPTTVSVSGNTYTLLEDLNVAENDTLTIGDDLTLEIEAAVRVTISGNFTVNAGNVLITAVDQAAPYDGFRFEEFSEISIQNATIEYGGGLRVLTETFMLDNSIVRHNVSGVASSGAVAISRGVPIITNNEFLFNEMPAIAAGATQTVSAYIFNNYIEGNNQANENRPQINLGTTMISDTLKIIQNEIIGDPAMTEAGGIAIGNFFSGDVYAIIEGNTIQNNRYGITVNGSTNYILMKNNIIEDNNIQGSPNLGGSGINLIASSGMENVIITGNEIRGNLWGVTLQNEAKANFGDDQNNPGGNIFADNGNGGNIYALFNNTLNTILAKHNCWVENGTGTLTEAESVISHLVDDPALGEVVFDPINCQGLGADDFYKPEVALYPNPSMGTLNIESSSSFEKVQFYDLNGRLVLEETIQGENRLNFQLPTGLYFVKLHNAKHSFVQKLIVK